MDSGVINNTNVLLRVYSFCSNDAPSLTILFKPSVDEDTISKSQYLGPQSNIDLNMLECKSSGSKYLSFYVWDETSIQIGNSPQSFMVYDLVNSKVYHDGQSKYKIDLNASKPIYMFTISDNKQAFITSSIVKYSAIGLLSLVLFSIAATLVYKTWKWVMRRS